ncbi:MAG: N(2)-fixation sustaining protein CowN [Cyanobacteria bacterium P01_A01_bin.123]
MSQHNVNRYISFEGTDCDAKSRCIISYVKQYADNPPHPSPWSEYFRGKLKNSLALGQDELFVVCSQMNNVRSLFEEYEDAEALNVLEQVEEDCC